MISISSVQNNVDFITMILTPYVFALGVSSIISNDETLNF